jgi:hypothetical protein
MRMLLSLSASLLLLASASPTLAEGSVLLTLRMGFPAVLPPLVEIEPGVRVVRDFDEEVFNTEGYYWTQRDGNWYRARDHRGAWRYVRPTSLPAGLSRQEPGHYRRFQHDELRTWPVAQHARPNVRHWKASDYQERGPSQERHSQGHQRSAGPRQP